MSLFENAVLASLGQVEALQLTAKGARIDLEFGSPLWEAGDRIDWVYFPEGALLSNIRYTEEGQATETGMAGYEGAAGLVEACGSRLASTNTVVQVGGPAWRVPAEDCRALGFKGGSLTETLLRQMEFQLTESRQSALCRSFHLAEARMARWLLESRDRSGVTDVLPMTQEFLAAMLGVRRTTVTAFAREMQQRDLIRYSRGKIEIIDPEGLESLACECRQVLVEERARLGAARSPVTGR